MFIYDKQWINSNGDVGIEYIYKLNQIGIGSSGIVVLNHESICQYYYIAVTFLYEKMKIIIAFVESGKFDIIAWDDIDEDYNEFESFELRVNFINGSRFEVY